MPIQKLQFRPGVLRDNTSLTGEGGWFECDKIRFRSGAVEKVGGWIRNQAVTTEPLSPPDGGSFWGICRWIYNWTSLSGIHFAALGTSSKLYLQPVFNTVITNNTFSSSIVDITPIRFTTTAGNVTLAATNGSSTLTMTVSGGHNAAPGDFFTISGAVGLGGAITATVLNSEFRVVTINGNDLTFDCGVTATAGDVGNGGALTVVAFQLSVGNEIATPAVLNAWGVGTWGNGPWGGTYDGYLAPQPRLWSGDNYGYSLIACPQYGGLYMWMPDPLDITAISRAVLLSPTSPAPYTTDADCPQEVSQVLVSDSSLFVITFGCNDYVSAGGAYDPMLVRWSDQEDYTVWTPAITNQAGSYRLSKGGEIVSVLQTRQEILIWTDTALYSMQYIGAPYVWSFNILEDRVSIASMNCVATASNIVFWMGLNKFYTYTGRVETLPCTLRAHVFENINLEQSAQFFAGTNDGFNEIWWFYCSANSTVIDSYVIFNYLDRAWAYGTLARTAWTEVAYLNAPYAAGYDGKLLLHETGTDDGSTNPPTAIDAYVQSSDFDIGDGERYAYVDTLIPDVTFDGSTVATPELTITVKPRQNPGSAYGTAASNPPVDSLNNYSVQHNYTVQRFTEFVYLRVRGRQMAFRIGSNTLGTQWQLGTTRMQIRPDGRRS